MKRYASLMGLAVLTLSSASCNIFEFMDSPSGEAQILEKARGCFDAGDVDCARQYYAKLSNSQSDVKLSELAFVEAFDVGIGMADFMAAFGDGGGGKGLGIMANRLAGKVDSASRQKLYDAYTTVASINDTTLKGLTRFVVATVFAAHILAESSGGDGTFDQTDLAASPAACIAAGVGCAGNPASCLPSAGSQLTAGGASTDFDNGIITTPNLNLFRGALTAINTGLSEMGASGNFGSGAGGLDGVFGALPMAGAGDAACFRQQMLSEHIGE
ncbi:MAG TPA: hypothetical protein VL588_00030 [Bdellovibrionota bacterium]|nr:hypothetical protein [Bdellovibrionota bacterium]